MLRVVTCAAAIAIAAMAFPCPSDAAGWTTAERIDRWFAELTREAGSSAGLVPLQRLWDHAENGEVSPRLDEVAHSLLDRRSTDPAVAARLMEWLGTRADRRGDPAAAEGWFTRAGYLSDWATMGPYPNYGGAAMARVVGPQAEGCAEGCEHDGRPMAWVPRDGLGAHGFVNLSACHEERSDVLAFVRTFVHVDEPTPVALRVGAGDGVVVEVGGRTLLSEPTSRTPAADQQAVGLVLPAGWTGIRVKAGQQDGSWGVYLRITTPDGRPLSLRSAASLPEGEAAQELGVEVVDPVAAALAAAEADDADADALVLAARLAAGSGIADPRDELVVTLLRRALEHQPDDPELLLELAEHTSEPDEQLGSLRRALELAPDLSAAWLALYRYHQGHANRRDDLPALQRAAADTSCLAARRMAASELRDLPAPEAALAELEGLAADHPHATTVEVLRAQVWLDLGDPEAALAAYDRGLALADLATTHNRRMVLRREQGDGDGALADARLLADRFPHALRYQRTLARERARAGDTEGAIDHLRAVIPRFPDGASLHRELGDLLHRLGRDDEAVAAWDGSLALRPRDPRLEQYMTFLDGGDNPLQTRWRRDPSALPSDHGEPDVYAGAPARVLLFNQAIQVFANGSDGAYVQRVIAIDSEVGARAHQELALRYDRDRERLRVLTAEVLHPDGTTTRARRVQDHSSVNKAAGAWYQVFTKQVVFDEVHPGDRIHIEFVRESRETRNRFDDFFGAMVTLQDWIPTVEASVHVVVPPGMPLVTTYPGVVAHAPVEEAGAVVYGFGGTDLAAIPGESWGPGYFDLGAYISASNFETWDQVAAWWLDLSRDQFNLGEEGRAIARELAADAPDTDAAVRRIYQYVQRNTHYVGLEFGIHGWKPYEAREVLQRGYGDCKDKATLLVAMLGEVGIDARFVLVQTVTNGHTEPDPASLYLFNHAIAYVPELDLYLDATAEFAPMESLRWDDQGALALRVALDGGAELVHIPISGPQDNLTTSHTVVQMQASGDMTFHEHWTERGLQVSDLRWGFADDSTRLEDLERNYQNRLTGVRLSRVDGQGFDDLGPEIVVDVQGAIPAFAVPEGPGLRVPVTLFPDELGQNLTPEGEASRRTDLVMQLPHAVQQSTTIEPPPGMVVAEVPAPVELDTPHAHYRQVVEQVDGNAVVRIDVQYRSRRVPLADYPAFRAFCLAVDRAQDQAVLLVPAEEAP